MGRFVIVALTLCALSFGHRNSFSSSGILGPSHSLILNTIESWKTQYPDLVEIIDYGKSVQGRTLRLALVRREGNFRKRPVLFMSGATHGNEYLNIEDRVPQELLARARISGPVSRFLDEGGVYVFVPILNPDGYENKTRENSNAVDLNRDWNVAAVNFKGFKEPETRALAEVLESLKVSRSLRYQITVDYHCCIGALLHPWSYPEAPPLAPSAAEKHQAVGELVSQFLNVDFGTTGDILGYFPVGTTKDYFYETYQAAAFTFEGRFQLENQRLDKHIAWWEQMTALVRGEPDLSGLAITQKKKRLFPLAD